MNWVLFSVILGFSNTPVILEESYYKTHIECQTVRDEILDKTGSDPYYQLFCKERHGSEAWSKAVYTR